MNSSSLSSTIIHKLSTAEHSQRMKKLLVYLCYQTWENEATKLEKFTWGQLLIDVQENFARLEQLSRALAYVINKLNRPVLYRQIGNQIIQDLAPLYESEAEETQMVILPEETPAPMVGLIEAIRDDIQYHPQSLRLTKMVFALVSQRWVNDPQVLQNYDLMELILELRQKYDTLERLTMALERVVASLNRQTVYQKVGASLLQTLQPLYPAALVSNGGILTKPTATETDFLPSDTAPSAIANTIFDPAVVATGPKAQEPGATITLVDYDLESPAPSESETTPAEHGEPKALLDHWELKIQVMKYTNPLRAKILLYSLFNAPFQGTAEEWSSLRRHDLGEQLKTLLQRYGNLAPADLSRRLRVTAESTIEPDEHLQAAGAIAQAIAMMTPSL